MKLLRFTNTGLSMSDFLRKLYIEVGKTEVWEKRNSLHKPSQNYFVSRYFFLNCYVYYCDENNENCTDYYVECEARLHNAVTNLIEAEFYTHISITMSHLGLDSVLDEI